MNIVLAVPSTGSPRMQFAYSWVSLVAYVAAKGIRTLPEQTVEMAIDVELGPCIHGNREVLVDRAMEAGRTHLMFFDEDMSFPPHILDILAGRRQPIVCTNYLIKSETEPDFVAVTLNGKRLPTTETSTGLAPIAYSGFGVSLFDLEVFRRTPRPWFAPEYVPEAKRYTTEDNPAYRRMREAGYQVLLDQDASKLVEHHGMKSWKWQDWTPPKPKEGTNANDRS